MSLRRHRKLQAEACLSCDKQFEKGRQIAKEPAKMTSEKISEGQIFSTTTMTQFDFQPIATKCFTLQYFGLAGGYLNRFWRLARKIARRLFMEIVDCQSFLIGHVYKNVHNALFIYLNCRPVTFKKSYLRS